MRFMVCRSTRFSISSNGDSFQLPIRICRHPYHKLFYPMFCKMSFNLLQLSAVLLFAIVISESVATLAPSEEDDNDEVEVIDIDEEMEFDFLTPSSPTELPTTPLLPPANDRTTSLDETITNNTRCSQTRLSFTKETLLHVWQIKGLIGYISYIKRFEQPFEVKTEQVSFKSDNVDGKWIFKVHKVRHHSPFSIHSSPSPSSISASASSANYVNPNPNEIGDIRIVATYSYEAKQPRNIDFILSPTIIHGSKEIALPPKKSTSPTIVQQKFYNTRGFQLNSNFLEYVYTFTWTNVMQPLNNIKNSLIHTKYNLGNHETGESPHEIPQKHQPTYYLHGSDNIENGSDELFEEITKTDFSGHFGDVTIKFVISAYFPDEPVSITSSRCNASLLDLVSHNLLEKLTMSSKNSLTSSSRYFRKDIKQQGFIGHGVPPYLRYSYSMLHDDRFADVALVVGEEELLAHRIILATSSPIFSAILENITTSFSPSSNTRNENHSECEQVRSQQRLPRILIEPQNIGIDSVQELLHYIYTGTVDNFKLKDGSMSHRLIIIADKYGLPELKRHCESFLLQSLTVDNAIEMYLLGARVSSEKITRKAMIIMKLNKGKVATQTEEFRELSMRHPTLMYDLFLSD